MQYLHAMVVTVSDVHDPFVRSKYAAVWKSELPRSAAGLSEAANELALQRTHNNARAVGVDAERLFSIEANAGNPVCELAFSRQENKFV